MLSILYIVSVVEAHKKIIPYQLYAYAWWESYFIANVSVAYMINMLDAKIMLARN